MAANAQSHHRLTGVRRKTVSSIALGAQMIELRVEGTLRVKLKSAAR
jgi:hypothetical protein